jgi:hypothetical protein
VLRACVCVGEGCGAGAHARLSSWLTVTGTPTQALKWGALDAAAHAHDSSCYYFTGGLQNAAAS